jgi:ubiquinone/menaquinone biosynthesis C-methylase UbiE
MKDEFYRSRQVAEHYDQEAEGLEGDVEFYASLACESAAAGLPVLELACGTGRISIPIAREGVRVVGLDRSAEMLAVARNKSAGLDNVRWVEGDMAGFDLGERFGLVFIPYRSFLLLTAVADQKACLAAARRHLAPGGRLALNFFNPGLLRLADWFRTRTPRVTTSEVTKAGTRFAGTRFEESQTFSLAEQVTDVRHTLEELDDAGVIVSRVYRNMRLRYVFRYEMEHLLALSGFEVEALYGGFEGEPFTDASSEMVWVATRREAESPGTRSPNLVSRVKRRRTNAIHGIAGVQGAQPSPGSMRGVPSSLS